MSSPRSVSWSGSTRPRVASRGRELFDVRGKRPRILERLFRVFLAAARDQNARNWKVDAQVQRGPDGGATLQVEACDNTGVPMSGLKFQGSFERPTDKRADRPVALAEVGRGIYRGTTPEIASGQWDLVLQGDMAGRRMFLSKNRVLLN